MQQQQATNQQQQQQIEALQQQDQNMTQQELPAIRQEISDLHNQVTDIEGKQQAQAEMPPQPEQTPPSEAAPEPEPEAAPPVAEQPAPVVATPGAKIQIVNESGVDGLAQHYQQQLQAKGYNVVQSDEVGQMAHQQTYIYYRPGYADQAVAIGHQIPNNQVVLQSTTLPDGVDILIMLGQDVK